MDETEFRDLAERTQLVTEMAEHPGYSLMIDRAKVVLFARQKKLVNGDCSTLEEYKAECAWMNGASFVLSLPSLLENELADAVTYRSELEQEDDDEPDAS